MDHTEHLTGHGSAVSDIDTLVVGAGVVGLAVTRALAVAGQSVIIAERHRSIGAETSSRNSEVIHAGIYYPPGSLKATTCVAGRNLLYRYCEERHLPHRRCGKIIVATNAAQMAELEVIATRARANGVDDLSLIDAAAVSRLEPELRAHAALLSPSTGIINSHAYMLSLLADAENAGAVLALGTSIMRVQPTERGLDVYVDHAAQPALSVRNLVNAGGLSAQSVARSIDGFPEAHVPALGLAKGSYFVLSRKSPFSRLVYPVPEAGGLGTHLTIDLAGAARFGPDVEWVDTIDYAVDAARVDRFYAAVRHFWPGIRDGDLQPGYAGIRPKIGGPGDPAADFVISGPADHGVPGVVNLFGIESPGLTASLALAELVSHKLEGGAS